MWSIDNRGRYDRSKLRYPSDLTDDEWALIDPLIPAAKRGGNKRTVVECRATIKVRIPDNQDEKVLGAWSEGRA
jgi:transposase